jgi:nucleotide-binding universal stress UspA family protein
VYDCILVPVDGGVNTGGAEAQAVDLAERYGAEIHGLFVADPEGTPLPSGLSAEEVEAQFLADREHPAAALAATAEDRGVPATVATRVGRIAEEIVADADEVDADLIVMATRGRSGMARHLLGSTTERTLRLADVSVLCVQGEQSEQDER